MKGVVYAKTGTKRDANSLSGYVLQNNGKAIAFSIMINGGTSNYQSYYELEDRILKLLVDNADWTPKLALKIPWQIAKLRARFWLGFTVQNHVVCLKWGNKYSAQYVNRLYAMVKRNLTFAFQFHCMTEDAQDINPEINILPLETSDLTGWWYKLHIFKKDFYGLEGQLLFIDLDMVIIKNLDEFFTYTPEKFCIMPELNNSGRYGSCLMRLEIGKQTLVWDNFASNSAAITQRLHGDQDWIFQQLPNASLWPKTWIQSYKYHCDSKTKYNFHFLNKLIKPFTAGQAKLPPQAKIIAFHGKPDPEDIVNNYYRRYKKASWLKDYWHE